VVNCFYLLFQIVIATDDVSVREAAPRLARLLRVEYRSVALIFGATLGLVVLATMASILATTALGLIAFVPLVGLAALPLQLVAWLLRGLVFEFVGLTALAACVRVYRGMRESTQSPGAAPDGTVHHISRSA
jgi:ABC-type nickel/cobalt efflux system permease component RcnA